MRRASLIIVLTFCLCACSTEQKQETFDATPATESKSRLDASTLKHFDSIGLTAMQAGDLEIHCIDVGQGDSTLIKCPNGTNILIDCGSLADTHPLAVRNYVRDHLDGLRLDVLVITHPDADHYNMIPYVLKGVAIGQLVMIGDADEHNAKAFTTNSWQKKNRGFADWLETIELEKVAVIDQDDLDDADDPSDDLFDSGDVEIYIVAAEEDDPSNLSAKNTRSIVLMVVYEEFACLLTGDATFPTEDAIVDRYEDDWLDVDVLKLGHHGSRRTSTSTNWLNVTKPEVCVVSASYHNSHGHPAHDVRMKVEQHTVQSEPHRMRWYRGQDNPYNLNTYREATYCTARNETIVISTNGQSYSLTYSD